MPKTKLEVVTAAARRAGVAAVDVPLDAQDYAVCGEIYDGLMVELYEKEDFLELSDPNAVPDWAFNPVSEMLSVKVAAMYGRPNPQNAWFQGMKALRRHHFPDDRGPAPAKEAAFY